MILTKLLPLKVYIPLKIRIKVIEIQYKGADTEPGFVFNELFDDIVLSLCTYLKVNSHQVILSF